MSEWSILIWNISEFVVGPKVDGITFVCCSSLFSSCNWFENKKKTGQHQQLIRHGQWLKLTGWSPLQIIKYDRVFVHIVHKELFNFLAAFLVYLLSNKVWHSGWAPSAFMGLQVQI